MVVVAGFGWIVCVVRGGGRKKGTEKTIVPYVLLNVTSSNCLAYFIANTLPRINSCSYLANMLLVLSYILLSTQEYCDDMWDFWK